MAGTLNVTTISGVSTLNDSSGVLATQNGMTGIAKAWVNFAGASGTVNGSFNVSSVTRNSTGNYTVTFTTAMANANYAISQTLFAQSSSNDGGVAVIGWGTTPSTTTFNMVTDQRSAGEYDPTIVCFTVHGA
jgi:hypothetical protein